MRRLRSALLFALCVVLPFAGSAGAGAGAGAFAAPSPCAVQHAAGADVTGHSAKSADCCEHHRPADAGPSCKAGHDCSCAIPGLPQASVAPLPPPVSRRVAAHDLAMAADVQPAAVWRPPTSL